MTKEHETALAQILSVCADSNIKISSVARACQNLTLEIVVPKTRQLKNALRMYKAAFPNHRGTSKEIIEKIVNARRNGATVAEICRTYHLEQNNVYYILQGKYAGAPAEGHNFPPTGEKRGRPRGSTKRPAL